MLHAKITEKIIKAFYVVYNVLGYGFLEKVYNNALKIELEKNGLDVKQAHSIKVYYDGHEVGDYYADIMVNELVILELKAAENLREEHKAQLLNYIKATDKEIGLLLNFGKSPQFERIILTNDMKKNIR